MTDEEKILKKRERRRLRYLREKTHPFYKEKCKKYAKSKRKNRKKYHYFKYLAGIIRYKYRIEMRAWDLWKIAKLQKLICPLTSRHLTRNNISLDHKIPLSKGGSKEISNLRFVDFHANLAKSKFSESELLLLAIDIVKTLKS